MSSSSQQSQFPEGITEAFQKQDPSAFDSLEQSITPLEASSETFANAISLRENGVFASKESFGPDHTLTQEGVKTLVLKCNSFAMQLLSENKIDLAIKFLNMADQHTSNAGYLNDKPTRLNLRAVTLNNLGCAYKTHGKLHTAIGFMEKALKLESSSVHCDNPAGTHLNICAILSELGRHRAAADHAKCAVQLLKYESALELRRRSTASTRTTMTAGESNTSVLAMAYFNWGVELEHQRYFDRAISCYLSAREIAAVEGQPLLPAIDAAIEQAKASRTAVENKKSTPRGKRMTQNSMIVAEVRSGRKKYGITSPRPLSPQSIRQNEIREC